MNDDYKPYRKGEQSPKVRDMIQQIEEQLIRLDKLTIIYTNFYNTRTEGIKQS